MRGGPSTPPRSIFVGDSPTETHATAVALASLRHWTGWNTLKRISRHTLGDAYRRPSERRSDGRLYDVISDAPMSTDHAIARFFIPWLCDYQGFALFTDGDILCRANPTTLFWDAEAHPEIAVWCVQHPPLESTGLKKDREVQLPYPRKNWSSVMLFNCAHPANGALDLACLNALPGRDLHRFCWLPDEAIGALGPEWNWLVNLSKPIFQPSIVHFTEGLPSLPEHADDPYAEEWFNWITSLCEGTGTGG